MPNSLSVRGSPGAGRCRVSSNASSFLGVFCCLLGSREKTLQMGREVDLMEASEPRNASFLFSFIFCPLLFSRLGLVAPTPPDPASPSSSQMDGPVLA